MKDKVIDKHQKAEFEAEQNDFQSKRVQNIKSKRKQNLVKKSHELARIASLKIVLVIYDEDH